MKDLCSSNLQLNNALSGRFKVYCVFLKKRPFYSFSKWRLRRAIFFCFSGVAPVVFSEGIFSFALIQIIFLPVCILDIYIF